MTWLLPSALGIAAAAIVAAIALHVIARTRPVAEALPTARFVPRRAIQARTRSLAPSDLLLLLLRAAAIGAIGVAVAGPVLASHGRVARIVLIDRSRAVADAREARDSVRRFARASDVFVEFDSAAQRSPANAATDSARVSRARGSISAALAAGTRAAVLAAANADSVELVLVSPLAREELDDATAAIRAAWPGRIRLVPVRAATTDTMRRRVDVGGDRQDAVAAGLSLMGVAATGGSVRLVRGRAAASDSAWARVAGHVLLRWPENDSIAHWARRETIDAIGGVNTSGGTLVGRFPRPWLMAGRAIARWADGEPAAVEHETGDGCVRDVGVLIDQASDLALRAPFRRFARPFLAPCGGERDLALADTGVRTALAGAGPLTPSSVLRDRATESSRWSPWLFALAALLLTGELAMRRTMGRAA